MSKQIDISSEQYREYVYKDGGVARIDTPKTVDVIEDEKGVSHRVVDSDGITHRPERGWILIRWKPFDGAPAFVA